MKAKHDLMIAATVFMGVCILASTAWAGPARQHRLEGAAFVIGVVALTKTIIDHHQHMRASVAPVVAYRHHRRPTPQPTGYWSIQKEWVRPKYNRVWFRGHHSRRGHWVAGHWKRIEIEPGYWLKKRVWVAYP